MTEVARCSNCNEDYPAGAKYCANCGASLADSHQLIRSEVATILAERLKDRQVVELELFESVVERLFKYVKWFSAALALPLAVIGIGLTIFGVEKVRDIRNIAASVDKEVKPKVAAALNDADQASKQATQARHSAEQVTIDVNRQLASARGVTTKVEDLSKRVTSLESQTANEVNAASKRIEAQVKEVDQRVNAAQSRIDEQQKKLIDTGEIVKSIFANSRLEQFESSRVGRYVVREGNKRRVVYMLLNEVAIPQSVQVQYYLVSEPRNAYVMYNNVLVFFWGDSAESLKLHPLLVSYVSDPNAKEPPYKTLSLRDDKVFADAVQLPDAQ